MTVADGKVLSQEIYVINEGSLTGEFKIRYNGDQPITIMPTGGIVRPGTKQVVKVRLCVNKILIIIIIMVIIICINFLTL